MAVEPLVTKQSAGLTVAFRCVKPVTGDVFDFDDSTWKADVAACTTPNLSATENTDIGDATHSLYVAELNMALLNDTQSAIAVVVQAIEVASPVVWLAEEFMWIWGGQWILWDLDGDLTLWGGI